MASEAKHTPGEWTVGQRMNIEAPDPFCGRVIVANAGKCSGIIPDAEQEANARLISAAPQLLAALKVLADEADSFSVSGVYFSEECMGHKGLKMAYAAIAKATTPNNEKASAI